MNLKIILLLLTISVVFISGFQYVNATANTTTNIMILHILNPGNDNYSPNGSTASFNVSGSDLSDITSTSNIIITSTSAECQGAPYSGGLTLYCSGIPSSTSVLNLLVINLQ